MNESSKNSEAHSSRRPWKEYFFNSILIMVSIVVAVALAEITLRVTSPGAYGGARNLTAVPDDTKIWAPPVNTIQYFRHPETDEPIPLLRNNLGLRMDRDIVTEELEDTTNIAVFGASLTENIRVRAEHTFPDVLQFLLNAGEKKFNVMNFGVGGYNVDQSYLRYLELDREIRSQFDQVVFLISPTHVWSTSKAGIASLDEEGNLTLTPRGPKVPIFGYAVRRLYLTYFFIDLYKRYFETVGTYNDVQKPTRQAARAGEVFDITEFEEQVRLFNAMMQSWRKDVEASGGRFHVAVAPHQEYWAVPQAIEEQVSVFDMHPYFERIFPEFRFANVEFSNDGHWNEIGNLVTAAALYSDLERELELPPMDADRLVDLLREYYATNESDWRPGKVGRLDFQSPAPSHPEDPDKGNDGTSSSITAQH